MLLRWRCDALCCTWQYGQDGPCRTSCYALHTRPNGCLGVERLSTPALVVLMVHASRCLHVACTHLIHAGLQLIHHLAAADGNLLEDVTLPEPSVGPGQGRTRNQSQQGDDPSAAAAAAAGEPTAAAVLYHQHLAGCA